MNKEEDGKCRSANSVATIAQIGIHRKKLLGKVKIKRFEL